MPKVSFITASYNYEEYISETISSILGQTFEDWELIIIDDGSSDNSLQIINEFYQKDDRIKLYTHENNQNLGLIKTLQKGISIAKGEYISFLESDDYITSDYLSQKLKKFSEDKSIGLVYNGVQPVGEEPSIKSKMLLERIDKIWSNEREYSIFHELMVFKNYIPSFSCVMVKKELMENLNWDCPQPSWIDWWLWIQISQKTKIAYIFDKLTFFRIHKNSYTWTSRKKDAQKSYEYLKAVYSIYPKIKTFKYLVMFYTLNVLRLVVYKTLLIITKYIKSPLLDNIWKYI